MMNAQEENLMVQSILEAMTDFDPTPEEADAALELAKGEWRNIHDNRAEEQWIDSQRFDTALARKLQALADMDVARALK